MRAPGATMQPMARTGQMNAHAADAAPITGRSSEGVPTSAVPAIPRARYRTLSRGRSARTGTASKDDCGVLQPGAQV
jgi:hypothetical protein